MKALSDVDVGKCERVASGADLVDSANQALLDRQASRRSGKRPQQSCCVPTD